jgi:putative ABC transport system permease protein
VNRGLLLRWSWRDLRLRIVQVGAIAAIIALGTGVYAGLVSTSEWRRESYDASYETLNAHDLHVELAAGTYVDPDRLVAAIRSAGSVDAVETRLVAPTQVDASQHGKTVLVPGRLVGVDVTDGGPHIDRLYPKRGQAPSAGSDAVALDFHFADHFGLTPTGSVILSGDREVPYVGQVLSPEYFLVTTNEGTMFAEANFAVVFAPLSTVESVTGRQGETNDAVVTVPPGTDRRAVADALDAHLEKELPDVALTVTAIDDDRAYRTLYDDIEGDQRLYTIFAILVLGGAAFAAFNLVGRVVEAQRREIGISMALGVPTPQIAIRPVLLGFQVALLGAVLGAGVGLAVGALMRGVLVDFFPLPVWITDFQPAVYLRGLVLGVTLPFVATLIPVWRAVRVAPVDAIRTGPTTTKTGGLAPLVRRLTVGNSIAQMPLRNVLRAPRRTLLTAFAIAAAIGTLVGVIGTVDSFLVTIDQGEAAALGDTPDRYTVALDGFTVAGSDTLETIASTEGVARAEPSLRIGGTLIKGDEEIETMLSLLPFDDAIWVPETVSGELRPGTNGVVLAQKAADDLHVGVGDTITLRHPLREGTGYRWIESRVPVMAVHDIPYRFVTFMDASAAATMNLEGVYNAVAIEPEPGAGGTELQRALFSVPGVASVQPVRAFAESIRDRVTEVLDVLNVVRIAVLLLALLIAFNTTAINADERAREHATMFAFGLPMWTVLRSNVFESMIVGALGCLGGIGVGYAIVGYITNVLLPSTLPDITVQTDISAATIVIAVALGIVAVALAPLLTIRKLRRMDIPATLRVVE